MIRALAGVIAALGLALAFLWWRLDAVAADRAEWKADAVSKATQLVEMERDRARTDRMLAELGALQTAIRNDSAATRRALDELEASNEEVRDYLHQFIPDDVVSVLWPDEDGSDSPDAAGGAHGAVSGKRPAPKPRR